MSIYEKTRPYGLQESNTGAILAVTYALRYNIDQSNPTQMGLSIIKHNITEQDPSFSSYQLAVQWTNNEILKRITLLGREVKSYTSYMNILGASNRIATNTRRGSGNFIIAPDFHWFKQLLGYDDSSCIVLTDTINTYGRYSLITDSTMCGILTGYNGLKEHDCGVVIAKVGANDFRPTFIDGWENYYEVIQYNNLKGLWQQHGIKNNI